jgi:hypothetical protein
MELGPKHEAARDDGEGHCRHAGADFLRDRPIGNAVARYAK